MYQVTGIGETLKGILTLNYDTFLEHAIEESHGFPIDYGIRLTSDNHREKSVTVLKLHGSFGWRNVHPIETSVDLESPLWIPPGIQKAKGNYPFNLLWGAARELLDCDILRITANSRLQPGHERLGPCIDAFLNTTRSQSTGIVRNRNNRLA
jgi:hypothetical protein